MAETLLSNSSNRNEMNANLPIGNSTVYHNYNSINEKIDDERDMEQEPTASNRGLIVNTVLITIMCSMFLISMHTILIGFINQLNNSSPYLTQNIKPTGDVKPTVILISLDGFRADYMQRKEARNLNILREQGFKTSHMIPSFPTITFPNHYTLVTGLYPESHGIIGNTFFDKTLNKTFTYTDPKINDEPLWWRGEPIWTTAQLGNLTTAVHMWPGSEALHAGIRPNYLQPFTKAFSLDQKINQLLSWLDLPREKRPNLIAAYFYDVDTAGHDHGPNHPLTIKAIANLDTAIGNLVDGIRQRNLDDEIDLVIVSDHGMAEADVKNVIYLDDIIDMYKIQAHHIFPFAGLIPKSDKDIKPIYNQLKKAAKQSNGLWDVYLRSEIPQRFHYSQSDRIPPIMCIQKSGWAFQTRQYFPTIEQYKDIRGLHGYDNLDPQMQALFLAKGPHFPKKEIQPFNNVELYGLLAKALGLTRFAENNGTESFRNSLLP